MIDAASETRCKYCNRLITQIGGGHRKREYCDETCRQAEYRQRKERQEKEARQAAIRSRWGDFLPATQQTLEDVMQLHSMELAQRIAQAINQELTPYRQIAGQANRAKLEAKFMALGEQVEFRPLMSLAILGGYSYWQDFMRRASEEQLLEAIAAAEYFLEGLVALRGDPQQRHIAELERQVKDLQARLDFEERFRTDVEVKHFKSWLRKRQLPQDTDFFKRFLADTRLPQHASRSMYEARLKQYGYSEEDIHLFEELWKDMLLMQS